MYDPEDMFSDSEDDKSEPKEEQVGLFRRNCDSQIGKLSIGLSTYIF